MGAQTEIGWTDKTVNIAWGCQEVSEGCQHCYARTLSTRWGFDVWGKDAPRRIMSDAYWRQPIAWDLEAKKTGRTYRVFTSSMADVFEDHPMVASQRPRLFTLIEMTPHLQWQILTKRPEHILTMVPPSWIGAQGWPANAWMMTSTENQRQADLRLPWLFEVREKTACPVIGVSAEPLLGPIDFGYLRRLSSGTVTKMLRGTHEKPQAAALAERWVDLWLTLCSKWGIFAPKGDGVMLDGLALLNWVITGGESGPRHRAMDADWVRAIRDQCASAGIAWFHKQNGGLRPKANGKELDGREHCAFPVVERAAEMAGRGGGE